MTADMVSTRSLERVIIAKGWPFKAILAEESGAVDISSFWLLRSCSEFSLLLVLLHVLCFLVFLTVLTLVFCFQHALNCCDFLRPIVDMLII